MLILLPPSETKRDGGAAGSRLNLDALSFPTLGAPRATALEALKALSDSPDDAMQALKLGKTQQAEIARNRQVDSSPTMPAMDRYTGVLYDALDAQSLSGAARQFLAEHAAIHSALFGLVMAGDPVPAYRLSHDSRVAGGLKKLWAAPITDALADGRQQLILDLRSEAYVALGPLPPGSDGYFIRLVATDGNGTRRALNHFNKKGKGLFVRALAEAGQDHADVASLLKWAADTGFDLVESLPPRTAGRAAARELELVVPETTA